MQTLDFLRRCGCSRVGVLGGIFDPPHLGHLIAANEVLHRLRLDYVVFMLSGTPPHKVVPRAPGDIRFAMTVAATADHPGLLVSRYELDNGAPVNYTVDTMSFLAELLGPGTELYFIMGADALAEISTWKEPDRLLRICPIVAVSRPGCEQAVLEEAVGGLAASDRVIVFDLPDLAVSSTTIRARVAAGETIRYLVPLAVETMIGKWGLYRSAG